MTDLDDYVARGRRRAARWKAVTEVLAVIGALLLCGALLFVNCNGCEADDDRALEAIEAAGLTGAILGGADAGACAENESSRHFAARNARKQRVEGTVCCGTTGIGKGCTIRWGR